MNEPEILSTFTGILRDLLGDDSIELSMNSKRADIPAWDSFQYVTFIAAVEIQMGVKFRVADVESFATVGDIVHETQKLLQRSG
jgi:acyl carrier protein